MLTGESDEVAIANFLLERGVGAVVMKLGARGCRVFDSGGDLTVAGFRVDAVDTTGAGDCFARRLSRRAVPRSGYRGLGAVRERSRRAERASARFDRRRLELRGHARLDAASATLGPFAAAYYNRYSSLPDIPCCCTPLRFFSVRSCCFCWSHSWPR